MSRPAVVFDGVWKKFRRGERHDSLRDLVPAAVARLARRPRAQTELGAEEFWAVRDVSFDVGAGEALGIIGPNGAGKSTILKLLTRILKPTRGRCELRGRAGALIEVAAGFHPDLTGRENVYLQGAIMGMKRLEIARKFDQIVEFAGVADFIDTQVKRYSSGMNARLGFAIAAHLDPDVMLIDEVLSVGDAQFQDKCVRRMRELIADGTPLVFISHNLPAIVDLCTKAIVIDHGAVRFEGSPAAAVQEYRVAPWQESAGASHRTTSGIRLLRADLLNERGERAAVFHTNGPMTIRIHYEASQAVRQASFAVDLHSVEGVYCAGINTLMDRRDFGELRGAGAIDLALPRLALLPGCYLASVGILDGATGRTLDLHDRGYPFSMISDRRELGLVFLDHEWVERPLASTLHERTAAERTAVQ